MRVWGVPEEVIWLRLAGWEVAALDSAKMGLMACKREYIVREDSSSSDFERSSDVDFEAAWLGGGGFCHTDRTLDR